MKKNEKKKSLTKEDIMKYEIADELGLLDKVCQTGWKSLTSRESGKIGGILSKRLRDEKRKNQEDNFK